MNPTDEQLDALEAAARSWAGTPFCERSAVKGAGADCHTAIFEVYVEAGWIPRLDLPLPNIKAAGIELVRGFFSAHSRHFKRVETEQPGDTLHFKIGRTSHFKLRLREGYFHCMEERGCGFAPNVQPEMMQRLHGLWRPRLDSAPA